MNLMDIKFGSGVGGSGSLSSSGGTEYVIKLRGLPWAATKDDILEFFAGCRIDGGRDGIHLVQGQGGRASGAAFVVPCSDGDLEDFTKNDRKTIGHRYIEVFRVKRSEMEWFVRREKGGDGGSGRGEDSSFGSGGRFGDAADNFVRLRGLPFECSKEDIQSFFEGLSVGSVQLMVDGLGRSTGEAYVEFPGGKGDADRALLKDRATIGHRYIEVFRVGPSEMKSMNAMASPRNNNNSNGGGPLRNQMNSNNNRPRPYSYQGRESGNNGRVPFGGGGGGGPSSFRMPTRYFSKGFEDDYMESSYGGSNGNWNKPPPPPPPPSYGGGFSSRKSLGGNNRPSGGANDCLLMRGLPYSAGDQQIRKFFEPLVPTEIDVIFDSTGRPSGTAKVQFGSKDDLTRAMAKHKERMDHRYIELFLHSAHS